MKSSEHIDAELLFEVQQKTITFEAAHGRSGEYRAVSLPQFLERVARDFRDALQAFSDLILDGRQRERAGLRVVGQGVHSSARHP